jgi:hypothetical protein
LIKALNLPIALSAICSLKTGVGNFGYLLSMMTIDGSLTGNAFRCINILAICGKAKFITFIGLKDDAKIAAEVFGYAVSTIESGADRCYRKLKATTRRTQGIKGSYIMGFLFGLEAKFKEQVKEYGWGLVLVRDKEVDEVYQKMGLKKPSKSRSLTVQDNSVAAQMGFEDGRAFNAPEKNLKLFEEVEHGA